MTIYALDPLREARWRDARAAREVADWLAYLDLQEKAPRTILCYSYAVWDLVEAFPEKTLSEITDGDIAQLLHRYPPRGRFSRAAGINSLFCWARRTRRISENPLDFIERPRRKKQRVQDIFTDAEIELLCNLLTPDGHLFCLMFETGLRKAECCNLARRDIALARGELVVRAGKGDKDRVVPLTQRAQQAVADLDLVEGLGPEDHLWGSRPGGARRTRRLSPITPTSFARWYRKGLERAGVRYRNPHTTRHTFVTSWRRGRTMPDGSFVRLELDELQLLLGHASIQTTSDIYAHLSVVDVAQRMKSGELETRVGS